MSGKDFNQQGNNPLYNQSIAFCFKNDFTIHIIRLKPYPALASFNQILFRLIFFFKWFLFISQIIDIIVII